MFITDRATALKKSLGLGADLRTMRNYLLDKGENEVNTFKHLSYKEWIKEHPDVELEEEDCPECDGTGETTCYHCGHETECEKCDGSGNLKTAQKQYKEQLARDKAALEKFIKSVGLTENAPA